MKNVNIISNYGLKTSTLEYNTIRYNSSAVYKYVKGNPRILLGEI